MLAGGRGSAINSTSSGSWMVVMKPRVLVRTPAATREKRVFTADCASVSTEDSQNKQRGSFSAPPDVHPCVIPIKTAGRRQYQPSQPSSPAEVPAKVPDSLENVPVCISITLEPVWPDEEEHSSKAVCTVTHTHFFRRSRNKTFRSCLTPV